MAETLLEERKRGLEAEYFQKLNTALVTHMREAAREAADVQALEEASGVRDGALMDELVRLGITPETLPAFALIPLLEVAWADGKLDDHERRAVLVDADAAAIPTGSPSADMLRGWLVERPPSALFRLWFEFTHEVCRQLAPEARMALELEMLARATSVARASGGFLGAGTPVSRREHVDLDQIKAAYRP